MKCTAVLFGGKRWVQRECSKGCLRGEPQHAPKDVKDGKGKIEKLSLFLSSLLGRENFWSVQNMWLHNIVRSSSQLEGVPQHAAFQVAMWCEFWVGLTNAINL